MGVRSTRYDERVNLVSLHQQGLSYHAISIKVGLNYYTVRKWIRAYKKLGWAGLDPQRRGPERRGPLSQFSPLVKYVVLRLKRQNPGWGLDLLLLAMRRQPSLTGHQLPSRTALYSYLRPYLPRLQHKRSSRTQRPSPRYTPTDGVHQRWQMDFKGEVVIEPAGTVLPFHVCDEHSSAPLAGLIYAAAAGQPRKGLTTRDIQHALRQVFTRWGRPQQLRMDRDALWVGSSRLEWPGLLLLWLVGLDIWPVINRPGRPTDNAQVERLNRTWLEHVAFSLTSASTATIQAATDQAWHDRLFHLPSRNKHCHGQAPAQTFPSLFNNDRIYDTDLEASLFDMDRVYAYLAQWQWQRKVDVTGCISLNNRNRLVGKAFAGQLVKVHFDLATKQFVATSLDQIELRRFTLPTIQAPHIRGTGSLL